LSDELTTSRAAEKRIKTNTVRPCSEKRDILAAARRDVPS